MKTERLHLFSRIKNKTTILVFGIMIAMFIISEIISPGFLQYSHLESVVRQAAFLGIVAIGQTFVILLGGIDLSVAAVITLSNVVAAQMMDGKDQNVFVTVIAVLLIGLAAGGLNGLGIRFLKIPPLIMTLGFSSVIQGISLIYSKGAPKGATSPFIEFVSTGRIGGTISGIIVIWIVLSGAAILILRRSIYGRSIYILGTNPVAARYSGINITKITLLTYIISGVMSAITGLLLVGYTGTSYLNVGDVYTMSSIAAVVIGGTAIVGGAGGYLGTIPGSLIMIVINSILTIVRIPESGRQITQGVIILLIVLLFERRKNRERA
jgi:ribose transport system permease protein